MIEDTTNIVNSAIINRNTITLSLHIPQLLKIMYDGTTEVDFSKGGPIGVKDGDLYYVDVKIPGFVLVQTVDGKNFAVECDENGMKEFPF